jgi:hypothetical protein
MTALGRGREGVRRFCRLLRAAGIAADSSASVQRVRAAWDAEADRAVLRSPRTRPGVSSTGFDEVHAPTNGLAGGRGRRCSVS